jgi:hypothetical protein
MSHRVIGRMIASLASGAMLAMASHAVFAQAPATRTTVPAAVLQAFQQAYPGATIAATARDRDRDRTVFRVDGVDRGRRRTVLYEASGTVVEVAEQVEEKELPKPVFDAMHSHPRAIYVSGLKVTRGGSVEYRLTVRGTRKTAMIAKPDGTVVSFK